MVEVEPFYQGKLDVFCAMYAVLNALKLTCGLRTLQARNILHETLLELAARPEAFRAVLEQRTDYVSLVDGLLRRQCGALQLHVESPFVHAAQTPPPPAAVWDAWKTWLHGGTRRAVIFRFLRHITPGTPPCNRHWTAACRLEGTELRLFDCSHETGAIHSISRDGFATTSEELRRDMLLCIEPHTVRLLASNR